MKGDTIEGNVTVSGDATGQRVIPWSAKQTSRSPMRMGSDGGAQADGRGHDVGGSHPSGVPRAVVEQTLGF